MPKTAPALPIDHDRPLAELLMRRLIGECAAGELHIRLPGFAPAYLTGSRSGRRADIEFKRWRALTRFLISGDIGLANAYRDGDWSTSDLLGLLSWAMENEASLKSLLPGSLSSRIINRIRHSRRSNTRSNSRKNIAAHYDLGNDFYARWLDRGMNYSSGIYRSGNESLEEAQARKIDNVCDLLELAGGERVLEIGCGWGAVAERLTTAHGCRLTGLTLSQPQRDYTRERLERAHLGHAADIRLQDYRDINERFDRVVSIEMLEAVGEHYWAQYFAKLRDCLRPGGVAVLQVITIAAERYAAYRERPDFIQLEIFPGGALPTGEIIASQAAKAGLQLTRTKKFGASYAHTLAEWRRRFNGAWDDIEPLGFDEPFRRIWNYYLTYCEVGFRTNVLDVGLYRLEHAR